MLAMFLTSTSALGSHATTVALSVSVEQGDTRNIDPADYGLLNFFGARIVKGPNFVNVPAVGSLENVLKSSTSLTTGKGRVEHLALHPNREYIYFFHRNSTSASPLTHFT